MNVPQPPPMPVTQITLQDDSQLHLLAVFHYIFAGLCLLGIGFVILHFMMMTFVFKMTGTHSPVITPAAIAAPAVVGLDTEIESTTTEEITPGKTAEVPTSTTVSSAAAFPGFPKQMIVFMIGIYAVIGAMITAFAIVNFMSARFIKRRKHRTFSLVVAGLNCIQIPFGTILGVFTIIALMRPSIQLDYDSNRQI